MKAVIGPHALPAEHMYQTSSQSFTSLLTLTDTPYFHTSKRPIHKEHLREVQ